MKEQDVIALLNGYIKKYPNDLPFACVDEALLLNIDKVTLCIDFIIDLFCKIGVNAQLAPSTDGILLDSCLEFLTERRENLL